MVLLTAVHTDRQAKSVSLLPPPPHLYLFFVCFFFQIRVTHRTLSSPRDEVLSGQSARACIVVPIVNPDRFVRRNCGNSLHIDHRREGKRQNLEGKVSTNSVRRIDYRLLITLSPRLFLIEANSRFCSQRHFRRRWWIRLALDRKAILCARNSDRR